MNNKSRLFWENYWKEKSEKAPADAFVSAWAFGSDPDHLLDLVKQGKKTATCSGHLFYEKEQEPLPKAGQYAVILDSQEEPKAIIEITHVDVMPMNEVPYHLHKQKVRAIYLMTIGTENIKNFSQKHSNHTV